MGEQVDEGGPATRTWGLILKATGDYLQKRKLARALLWHIQSRLPESELVGPAKHFSSHLSRGEGHPPHPGVSSPSHEGCH